MEGVLGFFRLGLAPLSGLFEQHIAGALLFDVAVLKVAEKFEAQLRRLFTGVVQNTRWL